MAFSQVFAPPAATIAKSAYDTQIKLGVGNLMTGLAQNYLQAKQAEKAEKQQAFNNQIETAKLEMTRQGLQDTREWRGMQHKEKEQDYTIAERQVAVAEQNVAMQLDFKKAEGEVRKANAQINEYNAETKRLEVKRKEQEDERQAGIVWLPYDPKIQSKLDGWVAQKNELEGQLSAGTPLDENQDRVLKMARSNIAQIEATRKRDVSVVMGNQKGTNLTITRNKITGEPEYKTDEFEKQKDARLKILGDRMIKGKDMVGNPIIDEDISKEWARVYSGKTWEDIEPAQIVAGGSADPSVEIAAMKKYIADNPPIAAAQKKFDDNYNEFRSVVGTDERITQEQREAYLGSPEIDRKKRAIRALLLKAPAPGTVDAQDLETEIAEMNQILQGFVEDYKQKVSGPKESGFWDSILGGPKVVKRSRFGPKPPVPAAERLRMDLLNSKYNAPALETPTNQVQRILSTP